MYFILNYFALKIVLLYILYNIAFCKFFKHLKKLFKHLVLHTILILQNDVFPYYRANQTALC